MLQARSGLSFYGRSDERPVFYSGQELFLRYFLFVQEVFFRQIISLCKTPRRFAGIAGIKPADVRFRNC